MVAETKKVRRKARALGFSHVGIAHAEPLGQEAEHLREWLSRGYQGTMEWMARTVAKRSDPLRILPDAKSVVCVAMNYFTGERHSDDPHTGKISRYAWGDDYHDILTGKLKELNAWMEEEFRGSVNRIYVDTGPVMDKVWAQRAGIGWQGKHTNLITQDAGSWVFLGEVITTVGLDCDEPATDHCGTCTLCIEACPTGAIVEPYIVDSNLCLSYLTIEHRGPIEGEVRKHFEGWIYGCDICQDVCPWNEKFSIETAEPRFAPRDGSQSPRLEEWSHFSQEEFSARFKGSPIKRTKREGIVRNAEIVLEGQQRNCAGIDPAPGRTASHKEQ